MTDMKRLPIILALLVVVNSCGDSGVTNETVHLDNVSVIGTHTNVWFLCNLTLKNQTGMTLIVTNLFLLSPGLALKITDLNGEELKRTYAAPLMVGDFTFPAGSENTFKLCYGVPGIYRYNNPGITLPDNEKTVRLQIEGTMSGSRYSGGITSNIVEVKIP
jgi:hypothetical protein